ncbi:MAG: hypothetical protein ACM3JG_00310 [Thiohalocapsa sp.]
MTQSPIEPVAAARFIIERLYRPLRFGTASCNAVAETEHPFAGDDWYWTDDNAKIVEFLARPEIHRHFARQTAEIVRFLKTMCRAPFIFRRVSTPRLIWAWQVGNETTYYHSLMQLRVDMPRGAVVAGLRFHDNRTADNVLFHTNSVEFTHRGRRYAVPVEPAIDDFAVALDGHRMELRCAGELSFAPWRKTRRLGRISYAYSIDARSMVIGVEAALDVDPAADIADVVLTIGHDHLSHGINGVNYSRVLAHLPGRDPIRIAAAEPGRQNVPIAGADYYAIVQNEIAGFALAVHSAPRQPGGLAVLAVLRREAGRLHFVRARYRFPGACAGRRLVAAEDKMLTAGGFYDRVADYSVLLREAAALRETSETAIDFSVSYDYGAELNAFAQYFVALAAHDAGGAARDDAKALFDAYLQIYFDLFVEGHRHHENTIFSRQLAFVILGLVTMLRATGNSEYRRQLMALCDILLEFEKRFEDVAGFAVSGFMMGVDSNRIVFPDCNSAALLALTEAAGDVADPRFAAAIDRGLGCLSIETRRIEWIDGPRKIDVVAVDWVDDHGNRHTNHAFWNYHAGLTLRLFAALRRSGDPGLRAVLARHRERLDFIEMILRWQIGRSLTCRDGAVEIRSSYLSAETNSETQPWTALGLLAAAGAG